MKNNKWFYVLAIAYMAFLLFCIFGCSPAKIGQAAVEKYKASSKFPSDCAAAFPVVVKEGEEKIDTVESVEINCEDVVRAYQEYWEFLGVEGEKERKILADSIAKLIARGQKPPSMTVKCPPSIYKHTRDTIIDKAAETAALRELEELKQAYAADTARRNEQYNNLSAKSSNRTKQRNTLFFINLGLLAAIAGGIYLKSKKKFLA